MVDHRAQRLDLHLSDGAVIDQLTHIFLNDGAQAHFLAIGKHSVKDLTVLLIPLLAKDSLDECDLVGVLCQLAHLAVSKTELGVEELQLEHEHLVALDVVECLVHVVLQVVLKTALQNSRNVFVAEARIDLLKGLLDDHLVEDDDVAETVNLAILLRDSLRLVSLLLKVKPVCDFVLEELAVRLFDYFVEVLCPVGVFQLFLRVFSQ